MWQGTMALRVSGVPLMVHWMHVPTNRAGCNQWESKWCAGPPRALQYLGVGAAYHTPVKQPQVHGKTHKPRSKPQQNMPNHSRGGVSAQRTHRAA